MKRIIGVDMWKLVSLVALPCGAVACGGVGAEGEEGTAGIAREAFGEASCGNAAPDRTFAGPERMDNSLDGTYDDGNCAHAFVVKINATTSAYRAAAVNWRPDDVPLSWGCNGAWAAMSLWKQVSANSYTKVGETGLQAGIANPSNTACLIPSAELQIPSTGTYKIIGQAGFVFNYEQVNVGTYPAETRNMSTQNDRGYTGDGDWAPGLFKGECASGRAVEGVSRIPTGNHAIRNLFCGTPNSGQEPGNLTLNITSGNDRRSTAGGDWDPTFIKGQCPDGSVITGVAQTSTGVVNKARCGPQGVADVAFDCQTMTFASGDARGSLGGGNWSPGDYRGQCEGGRQIVGISKDASGKPRSVLCCSIGAN